MQKERKTNQGKRVFGIVLSILMVLQMMTASVLPNTAYAEEADRFTVSTGLKNMPVKLTFDGITETGVTNGSGNMDATRLYTYFKELGWDNEYGTGGEDSGEEAPTEPSVKEVKVVYELNLPDASSPEARKEEGGLIDYKGAKGTFAVSWNNGKWNHSVKLDAPDEMEKLQGLVKMIPFGKTESVATVLSDTKVTLSSGKEVKTDKNGHFVFYGVSKENDPNKNITVTATDKYTKGEAELQTFSGTIYVKERPSVSEKDYEIKDTYNKYVAKPEKDTEYTVSGSGSNKVTLTRDGEGKDSVTVTLKEDGTTTPFYVIKDGICSDKMENSVHIDTTAPDLRDVETNAVDSGVVKLKKHGIYTKKKADLLITVAVEDKESGLKKLQLVGKNSDRTIYYDTYKVEEKNGKMQATFIIESKEDLLKEVLYLTGVDNVGNKSKDVLIRGSEEKSEITMEAIPPQINGLKVTKGKINKNGWYKEPLSFEVLTKDLESGLESVDVTTNNSFSLYSKDYEDKVLDEKTASFNLTKETIEKEKNKDGSYKILVKAVDNSGNITAKSMDVKVDLVAPKLSMSGVKKGSYLKKSPTLKIEEDEEYYKAKGNYFTVTITRDGKKHYSKTYNSLKNAVISSKVFSKDGNYKVSVAGEDAAGNKSNVVKTDFVKDATAPVVSIKGPDNNKYYNKAQTSTITVKERNYKTDDVHITVTRKLGKRNAKVSFPWKNKGVTSATSKKFSATGTYTVSAYAVDKAGNRSKTKTAKFTVDTVAPKLTIKGVSNDKTYQFKDTISPVITFSDDYLAGKKITLTRAGQNWYDKLAKTSGSGSVKFSDFAKKKANDGLYVLNVTVTDKAGNKTQKKIEFTVNRYGSSYKYGNAIKHLKGETVKEVSDNLLISEYNVSKLKSYTCEVRRDGEVIKGDVKTSENGKKDGYRVYNHLFEADSFDTEGVYEINVLSKDTAGNRMESKKENGVVKFTVDRTAPSLSVTGFEKINKADSVTLKIHTSDSLSKPTIAISVDGRNVLPDKTEDGYEVTLKKGTNQDVKVTVTDQAGNSKSFDESISVVPNGFLYFILKYKMLLIGLAVIAIAIVAGTVYKKKAQKK